MQAHLQGANMTLFPSPSVRSFSTLTGVMLVGRGFPDPRQAAGGKGPANPAGGSQAKAGVSRGRPVSGSAAGWKGEAGGLSTEDAAITSTFMQAWGGKDVFACPADAQGSVFVRQGPSRVPGDLPGCTAPATGASTGSTDSSGNCTLSVVANRSSAIGMLSSTAARARSICEAGAYMHWWVAPTLLSVLTMHAYDL